MGTRTCPDRSRLGLVVQLNRKRKKPDKIIYFTVRKLYPVTSELSRDGN